MNDPVFGQMTQPSEDILHCRKHFIIAKLFATLEQVIELGTF